MSNERPSGLGAGLQRLLEEENFEGFCGLGSFDPTRVVANQVAEWTTPIAELPNVKRLQPLADRDAALRAIASVVVGRTLNRVWSSISRVESPIEEIFLYGLIAAGWKVGAEVVLPWVDRVTVDLSVSPDPRQIVIEAQAPVGRYRADFLVRYRDYDWIGNMGEMWQSVIVECDGHDFHERTKQQAQRDKSRDRALQGMGYPVLRFAGSEIWADPVAAGASVVAHLRNALWRPRFEQYFRETRQEGLQRLASAHRTIERDSGIPFSEWTQRFGLPTEET